MLISFAEEAEELLESTDDDDDLSSDSDSESANQRDSSDDDSEVLQQKQDRQSRGTAAAADGKALLRAAVADGESPLVADAGCFTSPRAVARRAEQECTTSVWIPTEIAYRLCCVWHAACLNSMALAAQRHRSRCLVLEFVFRGLESTALPYFSLLSKR